MISSAKKSIIDIAILAELLQSSEIYVDDFVGFQNWI